MKRNAVVRLLALILALAVILPSAALAEDVLPEEMPEEVLTLIESNEVGSEDDGLVELPDLRSEQEQGQDGVQVQPVEEQPADEAEEEEPSPSESEEAPGDEPPQEPVAPALAVSALKLGVKEKYTLALEDGSSPADIGATFTSSKPGIASVNPATGLVTGVKKGTAVITMQTVDGASSSCEVTVLKAPTKVTLSASKLTLGVGEEKTIKAKLPSGSASAITFSSSNAKVASVDAQGRVVALKKGTATITAKAFNGKRATCKVTVKVAPKTVSLGGKALSLWLGDTHTADVTLSKNSAGAYSLASDNTEAVTVSGGKLKAVGVGSATVTVTTYNGLTAAISVQVCRKPVYRALLVGEGTFPGTSFSNLPASKDLSLMKNMLKSVMGAAGSKWTVSSRTNRTALQIHADIKSAFAGAQEGDVSLFYITTHGNEDFSFAGDWPEYAGYLMTYPDYDFTNWYDRYALTLVTLAEWLKAVPGQVIVIMDSCGSGAAIYGAKSNAAANYSAERFDKAVVNAFEAQDAAVLAPGQDEGAFVIQNKFYVLTAAGYREPCFTNSGKYSYFTKWLTDGIAAKGRMPADANKNKLTTLNELYKYLKKVGDKTAVSKSSARQHVQVYPANSGFGLFYRK